MSEDTREKIPGGKGGWIIPRKKGDPPTPGSGRPLGSKDSKARIKKLLETVITINNPVSKEAETAEVWDHILASQARKAILDHDTAAANFLLDRLEGKPIQYVGADPETAETQKQFDNLSLDELKEVAKGGKDFTEFEDIKNPE